jgi:hypothetical protein
MTPPKYRDLPIIEATGEHHAWDHFGRDDQLGTVNFLTPERIRAAAAEVHDGLVVNLSLPLNLPDPPMAGGRGQFHHTVLRSRSGRDDYVDGFYLQGSSQWDGLQHIRYREFGYYGGREEEALDEGALGMDVLARKGIVGRGVLVDVERHLRERSTPADPQRKLKIGVDLIEETLLGQGCVVAPGDVMLLRTGWVTWYLSLDADGREALRGRQRGGEGGMECPGLDPADSTAEWLWDNGISAVAADNPALEALRIDRADGFLHRRILALLGMPIGEFFFLDDLANACADSRRWTFLFSSAPLNIPRAVGSPANAYAVL